MKNADVLIVFTAKSVNQIIELGGTQSWVLNEKSMRDVEFVVQCYWNIRALFANPDRSRVNNFTTRDNSNGERRKMEFDTDFLNIGIEV